MSPFLRRSTTGIRLSTFCTVPRTRRSAAGTAPAWAAALATALIVAGCVQIVAPDPAVRYVAFGDSTTARGAQRDYADILRELMGEPPETFANEGRGGETSGEGLARLGRILEYDLYPNAAVWLYWEGGNDLIDFIQSQDRRLRYSPEDADYPFADQLDERLAEIQANIEAAIATLTDSGVSVFVATYFPVREGTGDCPPLRSDALSAEQAVRAQAYIARLNERIEAAAANLGAELVDVAAVGDALRADPAHYADCNHLSAQGNRIVAGLFLEAIREHPP